MVNHPVILRGFGASTASGGPLILRRTDASFVDGTMRDASDPAQTALLATRAMDTDSSGTLKLFQPVHRIYHLALFEAVCDQPGAPRLDPAKIESAGMVIRRVASSGQSGPFGEAWLTNERGPVGWRTLATTAAARQDPDPALRHVPDQGNAAVNAAVHKVLTRDGVYTEDIITLFVAGPDVCAAAGRTLVFGLIPTASADTGDASSDPNPYSDAEIADQVPRFLRAGIAASISELAGQSYTFETADAATRGSDHEFSEAQVPADDVPVPSDPTSTRAAKEMHGFLSMLKVLSIQLDAFGSSTDASALRTALAGITLGFADGSTQTADSFLATAADALVMSPGTGTAITMPATWPEVSNRAATAIRAAFAKVLQRRFASFAPRATRFDDPNARYRLNAFVRVTRDDGCAPDLVWADPSRPYFIAPWFDTSETPPVLVRLPPLTRANIKKLKPNVAFVVPRNLFNLLNCNTSDAFLKGNGKDCGNSGIDWICGFNIPIITLCAFIVLNIFLSLFNIIFFWLPFIKICFPLPRSVGALASPEDS